MRIISHAEFLLLPEGTIFQEYQTDKVLELKVKGSTIGDSDYHTLSLVLIEPILPNGEVGYSVAGDIPEDGTSFAADYGWGRDGLFENDRQYMVYEKSDVEQLIAILAKQLKAGYFG